MISRLIEFSIRSRFVVILATAALAVWGVWCLARTPIDAIPDLSENQVIVFTDWMGRSPREIDDQITYKLSVDLKKLAGVKSVRASSEFNFSMITVIFDDATDFYFARTRVEEVLRSAETYLPAGVKPYQAPDATALGQIFWYTVEGDGYSLDELRAIQDFNVRYQLQVDGVADVASVGGFVREYQVDVDPAKLRSFEIPLGAVYDAIARSNASFGGKVVQEAKAEIIVRGVAWLAGARDIENVVVAQRGGVPITVAQLARVQLGPEFRRSVLEKDGREATGGVVMMRIGHNPLTVTQAVKDRIATLQLPPGVRIVPFYDRTRLIQGAIHTLGRALTEEIIIASLAVILILTHLRSAFVVCVTLPLAVLISFILMYYLGVPSNIMSLSGIAISIGILVDAAVVMVENASHELSLHYGDARVTGDTTEIVIRACRLVGKPIFFAVLIMLISFIPVFALTGQAGKMFHPLAFTKTCAMAGVAVLAVTFVPAIIPLLIKGRIRREEDNWIVRSFINIYKPVLTWLMTVPAAGVWFLAALLLVGLGLFDVLGPHVRWYGLAMMGVLLLIGTGVFRSTLARAIALTVLILVAAGAWHLPKQGSEFMTALDEGSILDMPVTGPKVSVSQASDDLKVRDAVMRAFPEVETVVGKVGRADTPTDPSGMDMIETIVSLRPADNWPERKAKFDDILAEADLLRGQLTERGFLVKSSDETNKALINRAAMDAAFQFDRAMRALALARQAAPELRDGWTRATNRPLVGYAANALDTLLVHALRDQAVKAALLAKAPTTDDLIALAHARYGDFAKGLFLWRKTKEDLIKEMDSELQLPGWSNIWTQPIINRVNMLATGVRTDIGVKVFGPDQDGIQAVCDTIAETLKKIPGAVDVSADQIIGRTYVQVDIDRVKAARYGVNVSDVEEAVEMAQGGKTATLTVEGRQRFAVRVRYARDFWQRADDLGRSLVTARRGTPPPAPGAGDAMNAPAAPASMGGDTYLIPLAEVATVRKVEGPNVIKSEDGLLRSYVQLNVRDRDMVGFVEEARLAVDKALGARPGYRIEWSGQFEEKLRTDRMLRIIFPLVVVLIFVILYVTFNDWRDALLVVLAVPGALVGGLIFQSVFGFRFSVAVGIGYIACFGMATQTGIVMLVYLHQAIRARGGLEGIGSLSELTNAVVTGAVHRLRPKLMTEGVAIIGLMPMLWATGVGAEVIKPMAAPVLGGLLVADEVIDLLIPVIFNWYQARRWRKLHAADPTIAGETPAPATA
ncbi:MAG: efflux RND transporter permease subunit [Planctomycetota bacterium]|nr:efflux RND transporter permease subunit [Planctomycetota bacterium]